MQGCCRQADTDRLSDRQPLGVVDHEPLIADIHGVAVKSSWIGALLDPAAQHEACTIAGAGAGIAGDELAASLRKWATAAPFTAPATWMPSSRRMPPVGQSHGISAGRPRAARRRPAPRLDPDHVVGAHEGGDERVGRAVVDLFGRSAWTIPPALMIDDPIRHHHGLLAIVGDVDRGDPDLLLDRPDLVAHGRPDPGVEIGERLVEQQNARVDRERAAECHPLALSARQLGHRPIGRAPRGRAGPRSPARGARAQHAAHAAAEAVGQMFAPSSCAARGHRTETPSPYRDVPVTAV